MNRNVFDARNYLILYYRIVLLWIAVKTFFVVHYFKIKFTFYALKGGIYNALVEIKKSIVVIQWKWSGK